jgi:type II secretory pathway pseudopilin PulG
MQLNFYKNRRLTRAKGLSLVEILVVLGLFSGVATLALGALFNTQAINNKLVENQSILDNVNLSLQTVTRDIRYGTDFYCSSSLTAATTTRRSCDYASGGGAVLSFRSTDASNDDDRVTYYVQDGVLYKRENPSAGEPSTYQVTAKDIFITSLHLYVDGAYATDPSVSYDGVSLDYSQPRVVLLVSGRSNSPRPSTIPATFSIQTTVSPRLLDNI